MNIETLDKAKMDSIKTLADTSMKISEAKNVLFKLQKEENDYIELREKKALAQITKVFNDSSDLIDKTKHNYEEINELCKSASVYAKFLTESHEKFQKMQELFNKRSEMWEKQFKKQQEELAGLRKTVEIDQKEIKERHKEIEKAQEQIKKEREQIESRQQALINSYKAEKDLWEKIQKKN